MVQYVPFSVTAVTEKLFLSPSAVIFLSTMKPRFNCDFSHSTKTLHTKNARINFY